MRPAGRVAILGGSGFIGSHILAYGHTVGVDITPIAMPRVAGLTPDGLATPATLMARAHAWRELHSAAFTSLCRSLEPFDIVVNAAGLATPRSTDLSALFSANAVLPALVAQAAGLAGVRRLIHISTAAVQGRLDPLDETPRHFPLSPYAASKADAERFLLDVDCRQQLPPEVVVYRPTSVHGTGKRTTWTFARLVTRLPAVPVANGGVRPVPVALIENVAAGVLFAVEMPQVCPIILQPYEQMTATMLLELFGARRVIHVPEGLSDHAMRQLARMASGSAALTARLRWCEVLLHGQAIQADALAAAGFRQSAGHQAWLALGRRTRDQLGASPTRQ